MLAAERHLLGRWSRVPAARRDSARNLLHYLAMRRRDLRTLQLQLAARGLSSLGRAESQAMAGVGAVLAIVRSLRGDVVGPGDELSIPSVLSGRELLEAHTSALLGPPPAGRDVRIMVTMPSEAADDGDLVRDLLASGMDCMRVNAAHDDANAWDRMLRHLERARAATGRPCRIVIDLAGPKLRTGPIQQLGADKGVNLPESTLRLPALTPKDREDLRFIDGRADLVGYSFVRTEEDVRELQSHLETVGGRQMGIVLKIETRKAFQQLPALLLAAMSSPSAGVMITDAAMSERAECVMLNKGPYVVEAVRVLNDILTRMQAHQRKSAMLRDLRVAERFLDS